MFIPINIDSNSILSQYTMTKDECNDIIDHVIKDITRSFAVQWENEAKAALHGTRDRYIANLSVIDTGRMTGAVVLDYSKDPLIQMIEEGASPFDMKENFSKSSKKKIVQRPDTSMGWYLTIPFTMGTPTSQTSSGFTSILPKEVYNVLKEREVNPITQRSKGLQSSNIPEQFRAPRVRAAIVIPESADFKEYKHKASIFEGAYKQKDSVTGQSSYGSFRRVSDNSDENSWIFPGLTAKNLAEKAWTSMEPRLEGILEISMNSVLTTLGFEK